MVAVLGTGAFATAFTRALLATADPPRVVVLGRRVTDLDIEHRLVEFSPEADYTAALDGADLVVVAASLHSPYSAGDDAWSALVARSGFGFTTLLQAPPAIRAAQAAQALGVPLINACYPDLINPLLSELGLPVLCGLGNAHTLTSGLSHPVRMLAHHRHLKPDAAEDVEVLDPGVDVRQELRVLRARPRRVLNDLGAAAGGALVARLLAGQEVSTNLPGPAGLPGGWPVRVSLRSCVPDLPEGTTRAEVLAWNRRHGMAEGVTHDGGELRFHGAAAESLRGLGVVAGDRVPCEDWERAVKSLLAARRRWGALPERTLA